MPDGILLGVDVGGTFTDVLALDAASGAIIAALKLPSTPADPGAAALESIDRWRARSRSAIAGVFHGSTVGTNTLIERKGAVTALVTTKGFRDVLALRRQARPRLYDLAPAVSPPLVPRERRFEVAERRRFDGSVAMPLDDAEIARVVAALRESGAEAVAVALLHAYADDAHERRLGAAIAEALPDVFLTLSSGVCRELREYERTSTAVVNAYIGPAVSRYVGRLEARLAERGVPAFAIVKSNGGLTSAANAARTPAQLIESGPAAGIAAAAALGRAEGIPDLIAFDMGGTTAKAGVVRGFAPRIATEFQADRFVDGRDVGGYPILAPVIDVIEIGAGGGSIARLDAAGVLKVGPESAGADPGPACYGRGGTRPTVTDAHVALGHVATDGFGSEDLTLDPSRAEAAIARIAEPLGWSVPRAAWGILRLATASMAEMVRLATLRRGLDPRDFALVAFGGAGALHAAEIAREVGLKSVIVPPCPGLFSAVGTVLGDVRHDLVQSWLRPVAGLDATSLDAAYAELERRAWDLLAAETAGTGEWTIERRADLRYEGQLFDLTLDAAASAGGSALDAAFRAAYREGYGYDLERHAVQLVALRLVARRPVWTGGWPTVAPGSAAATGTRRTRTILDENGRAHDVAIVPRATITPGETIAGPAVIEDFGATIRVLAGQAARTRPSGVLEITEEAR